MPKPTKQEKEHSDKAEPKCARCGQTLRDGYCDYCCGDPECETCS